MIIERRGETVGEGGEESRRDQSQVGPRPSLLHNTFERITGTSALPPPSALASEDNLRVLIKALTCQILFAAYSPLVYSGFCGTLRSQFMRTRFRFLSFQ